MTEKEFDLEIERVRKEINDLLKEESKKKELGLLKEKLRVLQFRKKNEKLLKFTSNWENGIKKIFKGVKVALTKTGKALEKSDAFIAKQKLKEAEQNKELKLTKDKLKKPFKDELNEALGVLD